MASKMSQLTSALLSAAVLGLASTASANTGLFSNLNQTPDANVATQYGGQDTNASDFITGISPSVVTGGTFSFANSDDINHVMTPAIYSSIAGLPGTLIGTLSTFTVPAAANPGDINFANYNATGDISLAANTIYWMVISIDQPTDLPFPVIWNGTASQSNTGVFSTVPATPIEYGNTDATWGTLFSDNNSGVGNSLFSLQGSAVPEPSSGGLLLLSAAGLPLLRRWRATAKK